MAGRMREPQSASSRLRPAILALVCILGLGACGSSDETEPTSLVNQERCPEAARAQGDGEPLGHAYLELDLPCGADGTQISFPMSVTYHRNAPEWDTVEFDFEVGSAKQIGDEYEAPIGADGRAEPIGTKPAGSIEHDIDITALATTETVSGNVTLELVPPDGEETVWVQIIPLVRFFDAEGNEITRAGERLYAYADGEAIWIDNGGLALLWQRRLDDLLDAGRLTQEQYDLEFSQLPT